MIRTFVESGEQNDMGTPPGPATQPHPSKKGEEKKSLFVILFCLAFLA